jgi:ABC-2 type transport system ATP-binding protein
VTGPSPAVATALRSTGTGTGSPIIEVRDVTKDFGEQRALDEIDLTVPAGVVVGLIGPSGCGKSTLIRLLTGISRPTSGTVRVFGSDPAGFTTRQRRRFGYMPQLPVLFPNLTVWGNLNFIASVYGMSLRGRRRHLLRLLELVDLSEHRHKRLADCSGGMQRRLTLAATLVHRPELLYLDEPTAGVDPILRERFWEHFRTLRDQGHTIVVPTQYVGEAVSCDVVAVMAAGRVITVQRPDTLARFAYGGDPLSIDLGDDWLSGPQLASLRQQPFVRSVRRTDDGLVVAVDDEAADLGRLQQLFAAAGVGVKQITPLEPTFDEMFVLIVEANTSASERAES